MLEKVDSLRKNNREFDKERRAVSVGVVWAVCVGVA